MFFNTRIPRRRYAQPGSLKWKVATGGQILSSPVIAPGGDIFVGSRDEHLYVIEPEGKLRPLAPMVWSI